MSDDFRALICVGILVVVGALVSALIGAGINSRMERAAAVKAGAAHYEADPKTGETRFVYGKPE